MFELINVAPSAQIEGVTVITLDSPSNRNALSRQLLTELASAFANLRTDVNQRAVLLRSSGRVFCSGADLDEALEHGMDHSSLAILALLRDIVSFPVPVVAEVNGPTRAGGLGILSACDIVVADEDATFAFSEAKLGLAPAVISATVLPVMPRRATALTFLTAGVFDGRAAQDWGLVTLSVQSAEVGEAVHGILTDIASCKRQGLVETKALLSAPILLRLDDIGPDLAMLSTDLFATDVVRESMAALLK